MKPLEALIRAHVARGEFNHLSVAVTGRGRETLFRADYRAATSRGGYYTATADDPVDAIRAVLTADDMDFG